MKGAQVALVGELAICLLGAGRCGTTGLSTQQVGSLNLSGANGHERRHYLSRALELYRGKYLEDCYMDFAVSIREGLERQLVSSALELLQGSRDEKDRPRVIDHGQQALTLDPSSQEAYQWMMEAYRALGRPKEAIRLYESCKLQAQPEPRARLRAPAGNRARIPTGSFGSRLGPMFFWRLWLLACLLRPAWCETLPVAAPLQSAQNLLSKQKWASALECYQGILSEQPGCQEAIYGAGWIYNQQGKFERAVPLLTEGSRRWPEDVAFWNELGYAHYRLGDVEKSCQAYSRAAELDQSSFQSYRFLGDVLYDFKREPGLALSAYQKALERGCRDPRVFYRMGWCLNETGYYAQAAQQLSLAVEGSPEMAGGWLELGYARLRSDQPEAAVPALRKAISLDPKQRLAHLYLGRAYLLLNDRINAEAEVKTLDGLDPELARQLQKEIRL